MHTQTLDCPKCDSIMQPGAFNDIPYHRCEVCEGLWMKTYAKYGLLDSKGSEVIDTPAFNINGHVFPDTKEDNKDSVVAGMDTENIKTVKCPACRVPMRVVNYIEQPHILLEKCPQCSGYFWDAGEFNDAKFYTPMDFLKSMFK